MLYKHHQILFSVRVNVNFYRKLIRHLSSKIGNKSIKTHTHVQYVFFFHFLVYALCQRIVKRRKKLFHTLFCIPRIYSKFWWTTLLKLHFFYCKKNYLPGVLILFLQHIKSSGEIVFTVINQNFSITIN